jgi:hypothetical protein
MNKKFHNLRGSYKSYTENSRNPMTVDIYLSIVKGFIKFLMAKLFQTGEIKLPERMGILTITGKKVKVEYEDGKIKGLAPNWAETKRFWAENPVAKAAKQLIYHFNEETNGVRYKFTWSKSRVLAANKTLYDLRMTRTNKRLLSSLVKGGKEYIIKK